jgi:Dna[CI] antecedent DciA-like protein
VSSSQRNKPAALGSLLASSREAAARYAGTAIDREQWRRIVGERIAARTEPGAKRGRELTVHVASASWAQELSLLVNEIVIRLKAAGVYVDTVRFRVKEIAATPRDPAARKPTYRKALLPGALSDQLERIEDSELRDAIGEAAALWLALDEAQSKVRTTQRPSAPPPSRPPAPTSARPNARDPRAAESQSARSERTAASGRAKAKGKP